MSNFESFPIPRRIVDINALDAKVTASADSAAASAASATEAAGSAASASAIAGFTLPVDLLGRPQVDTDLTERRVNILPFKQALEDIRDGTRKSLRILTIGDSLATFTQKSFWRGLVEILEPAFPSGPVTRARDIGDTQGAARQGEHNGASTSTRTTKTDYTAGFVGIKTTIEAGQVAYWSVGGFSIDCDRILVPLITETGGGSVKIEISETDNAISPAGKTWRNPTALEAGARALTGGELIVSADGAYGCDVVALTFATMERRILRVTSTSGTVKMLDPMFEVRNSPGINVYANADASNGFAATLSSSIPVMAQFIAGYEPDIIVVVSDDSKAAYENFLPHLAQTLTDTGLSPQPYVVLVGNPGLRLLNAGTPQADLIDRIGFCAEYAAPRGWDNFDGMAIGLGIENLQTFQRGGDDIHLNEFIWREATREWARSRGVLQYRENLPGGNVASRGDIAKGLASRQIDAKNAVHHLLSQTVVDTGWMGWGFAVAGTATGSKGNASLALATGTTAGSTVKAYVDDGYSPLGHGNANGLNSALDGAWSLSLRLVAMSANGLVWVTSSQDNFDSGYSPLAAPGFGFRISNNVIEGVSWTSSLQVSPSSFTATVGGTSAFHKLECIWTPDRTMTGALSGGFGVVEWLVDGVSLGTRGYTRSGTQKTPIGIHLSNGADATNNSIVALPPRLAVAR